MKFLNRKEQVIDFQLTQYGKYLLSKGKLLPHYYAFYDDDILYDVRFYTGDTDEAQNESHDRIKEMVRPETQYTFSGIETQHETLISSIRQGECDPGDVSNFPAFFNSQEVDAKEKNIEVQPIIEKEYSLANALGNSSLDNDKIPAWSVQVLKGKLSSSNPNRVQDSRILKIPQLDMDTVKFRVEYTPPGLNQEEHGDPDFSSTKIYGPGGEVDSYTLSNGATIKVFEDSIVLEVNEENTDFENENFDIEVYEVETVSGSSALGTWFNRRGNQIKEREILTPLSFQKERSLVKDGILLEPGEVNQDFGEIDPSYVEYYFNINMDQEIDPDVLCELTPTDDASGLFSSRELDCNKGLNVNILNNRTTYTTDVSEEDISEECE